MTRRGRSQSRLRFHWARIVAFAIGTALATAMCGCAQHASLTELPDLTKDPRKLLTKDEQKRAISDLGQSKEAEITAAEKQIAKSH